MGKKRECVKGREGVKRDEGDERAEEGNVREQRRGRIGNSCLFILVSPAAREQWERFPSTPLGAELTVRAQQDHVRHVSRGTIATRWIVKR